MGSEMCIRDRDVIIEDAIWINDGAGSFTQSVTLPSEPVSFQLLADWDSDGDLDLVTDRGERGVYLQANADLAADVSVQLEAVVRPLGTGVRQLFSYQLIVRNDGPSEATDVAVSTAFPAAMLENLEWTCRATSATCAAGGTGQVEDTVTLPSGSVLTYFITGSFVPEPDTQYEIVAEANLGATTDIDPSNNTSRDVNTLTTYVLTPAANSTIDGLESVSAARELDPSSVGTTTTLIVSSHRTGVVAANESTDNTIEVPLSSPESSPLPGEQFDATLRETNTETGEVTSSVVWQFRTEVDAGTGFLGASGQVLEGDGPVGFNNVRLADFDGDGDLDFAATDRINSRVSFFDNDGGVFTEQRRTLPVGSLEDITFADFDQDGDPDLLAVSRNNEIGFRVLENDEGTFRTRAALFPFAFEADVADVDGDGDLDFFGTDRKRGFLMLNEGELEFSLSPQGFGQFGLDEGFQIGTPSEFADVDGDGDLDIVSGDLLSGFVVRKNDGNGIYSSGVPANSVGGMPSDLALADYDGDGDVDVAASFAGQLEVWWNDGDGLFNSRHTIIETSINTERLTAADIDADGDLDLVGGAIWINETVDDVGTPTFSERAIGLGDGLATQYTAVGDLDGNGSLDAIAIVGQDLVVLSNADVPTDIQVAVEAPSELLAGSNAVQIVTVTNSGNVDVVDISLLGQFGALTNLTWTCESTGGATCAASGTELTDTLSLPAGSSAIYTVEGLVNPSLAGAVTSTFEASLPGGDRDILPLNNQVTLTQAVLPFVVSPDPNVVLHDLTEPIRLTRPAADLDPGTVNFDSLFVYRTSSGRVRDGLALAVTTDSITLTPESTFEPGEVVTISTSPAIQNVAGEPISSAYTWTIRVGSRPSTGVLEEVPGIVVENVIAAADFNGDGRVDVVTGTTVLLALPEGGYGDTEQDLDSREIHIADVDADGDLDVVAGRQIKLNDGTGLFTDGVELPTNNGLSFGDFNFDGFLDIAMATTTDARVLFNDGNANFEDSTRLGPLGSSSAIVVEDFDNNGSLDIVVGRAFEFNVWLNEGTGEFEEAEPVAVFSAAPESLVAGDFDGDGLVDVIHSAPNDSSFELRNIGNGQFVTNRFIGSDLDELQAADLDGDGDLDLIGSGRDDQIFFNEDFFFNEVILPSQGSRIEPAILGDFDSDGDLDVFVNDVVLQNRNAFAADVNSDFAVDFSDFLVISANFGTTEDAAFADGDVDEDGDVDFADFLILADEFSF